MICVMLLFAAPKREKKNKPKCGPDITGISNGIEPHRTRFVCCNVSSSQRKKEERGITTSPVCVSNISLYPSTKYGTVHVDVIYTGESEMKMLSIYLFDFSSSYRKNTDAAIESLVCYKAIPSASLDTQQQKHSHTHTHTHVGVCVRVCVCAT